VYRAVRRRLPRIGLATVYRNLEKLSAAGLLRMLHLGGGQMRFDGRTDRHYHVVCARCGKVDDVPAGPFPPLDSLAEQASEYAILGHRLEFEGICRSCGQKHKRARATRRAS